MLKIKSRIWIESEGDLFLGNGRIQLLKAIDQTGSLSDAARVMRMSYKKAWNQLESMNNCTDQKLVKTKIGGAKGGGTQLTDYGKKMIICFDNINQKIHEFLDECNDLNDSLYKQ